MGLALMIVLWLLIMRALGIELRMHIDMGVWRAFFDGLFFLASLLLAIFYRTALANVIRGVPLGEDGYFFLPLWTNWRVGQLREFSIGTRWSEAWLPWLPLRFMALCIWR
jgi:cytochrome bd ubiquinol oxidase subunit II